MVNYYQKNGMYIFKDVCRTSLITMYPRIFTDIPYSRVIYDIIVEEINEWIDNLLPIEERKVFLAPELEYRYKMISKVINNSSYDVIVELGAGLSSRGLMYCNTCKYLEIDFPDIVNLKSNAYAKMENMTSGEINNCPDMLASDVLTNYTWDYISDYIENKRVLFVNEGLMRYLTFDERSYVASNISSILKKNGGKWVTADVTLLELLKRQNKIVFKNGGIDNFITSDKMDYAYRDIEEAIFFYKNITNMNLFVHEDKNIILSSIKVLGLNEKDIHRLLRYLYIFELYFD